MSTYSQYLGEHRQRSAGPEPITERRLAIILSVVAAGLVALMVLGIALAFMLGGQTLQESTTGGSIHQSAAFCAETPATSASGCHSQGGAGTRSARTADTTASVRNSR
jgi:hypothetical protein